MKAKNLKAKPYIIPTASGNIVLATAGKAVEIPEGADLDYLKKLAENGMIELSGKMKVNPEKEDDSALEDLRAQYLELSGEEADGRWKEDRLKEEIEKLSTEE